MNPMNYDDKILDKRFQTLTPVNNGYVRKSFFWNNPEIFSIREARDGISFNFRNMLQKFKLSKHQLEKLRKAKLGQVIPMTNKANHYNNWFVILIDEDEEQKIREKRIRLQEVDKEIKELVGELQAERKTLREIISAYERFV